MKPKYIVIISADFEWQVVKSTFPKVTIHHSSLGEWFTYSYFGYDELINPVLFTHGGWGKVASASSSQYIIDKWKPELLINLGTCGGFEGEIKIGEVILAERTIIYDIFEQMGDADEHIAHYSTEIDTSWLIEPLPYPVKRTLLLSGDRDLFSKEIKELKKKYRAMAGDWESGAIAWVANKNHIPCLILRGVTDLVGEKSGQAYDGNIDFFYQNTKVIMNKLLTSLPEWLRIYYQFLHRESRTGEIPE